MRVTLNEAEDLFVVELIDENGKTVDTTHSVFCDNLVAVIDGAVEKTDNYEKSICEEYGIITENELCESDTGQPTQ